MAPQMRPIPGENGEFDDDLGDDFYEDDDLDEDGLPTDDELESLLKIFGDQGLYGHSSYGAASRRTTPEYQDRKAFVEASTPAQLAAAVESQPMLAAAFCGVGRLAHLVPRDSATHDPLPMGADDLALLLSSTLAIATAIEMLSPAAARLLEAAVWHAGVLSRADAESEFPGADPGELDAAAEELSVAVLSDASASFVSLRPGVSSHVRLPGPLIRQVYLGSAITNPQLDDMLKNIGLKPPGRREPKVDALEAALRNPTVVVAIVGRLSDAARELLTRLVSLRRPTPLPNLGLGYFVPRNTRYPGPKYGAQRITPLHELFESGLVHVDSRGSWCAPWLDTIVGLNGGRLGVWPESRPVVCGAINEGGGHPACVGQMQALLDQWAREPAAGTKTGTMAVQGLRATGKQLGIPERDVRLLASLAMGIGLMNRELVWSGRGRNATTTYRFQTAPFASEWTRQAFAIRWGTLALAWLNGLGDDDAAGESDRRVVAHDLLTLEPGTGPLDLPTFLAGRRQMFVGQDARVRIMADDMIALGLIPADGPCGLVSLARVLLIDPGSLADAGPTASRTFIVQADHTVIAPPDLDPDIASRLARLGTIESKGSVTVLRLDQRRIAGELTSGSTAADINAFLAEFASAPVPAGVVRLVDDAERAASGLVVHRAATVVTVVDAAALTKAIAVKAAKLTAVSPTTAISTLPIDKVLAALRAKGLAPKAPDAKSTTPGEVIQLASLPSTGSMQLRPSVPNRELLDRLLPGTTKVVDE